MESLLRLSGLLGDDDGATDLGTLEKRLAEKNHQQQQQQQAKQVTQLSNPTSPAHMSGLDGNDSTPQSSLTSPEPGRDKMDDKRKSMTPSEKQDEEEVEALSEMMCSLVTNQSGETRYIGALLLSPPVASCHLG